MPTVPAELIALVLALEERDGLEEHERRRLDREIGTRHADVEGTALLRAWLADAPSAALRARLDRVTRSLSALTWLLLAIGFFLGWAAAAAMLSIEVHAGRINIVLCLGLLVVVPGVMLVASVLGWLWSSRRGAAPDGSLLAGWLQSARPGRLAMRLVPPSIRPDVEVVLGRLGAHGRLYGGVQRSQFLLWSQRVGLGFSFGALVATAGFVVFTDLAFGWSTTLDVEASAVHRVVTTLARPWAALWPEAVPSLELVETTRHFRVAAEDHIHFVDPIVYGGWWPFLVASLILYSLLPRLVSIWAFGRGLARQCSRAMALTPGVDRLVERLTNPIVETRAEQDEAAIGLPESGLVPSVVARDWLADRAGLEPVVVRWAEASEDEQLFQLLGTTTFHVRDAGGRKSLQQDADLIVECGRGEGGVALVVRAYEPPVLDVLDFLLDLRRAVGELRSICVFLLDGSDDHAEAWRHKLMGMGDPGLRVARLESADD